MGQTFLSVSCGCTHPHECFRRCVQRRKTDKNVCPTTDCPLVTSQALPRPGEKVSGLRAYEKTISPYKEVRNVTFPRSFAKIDGEVADRMKARASAPRTRSEQAAFPEPRAKRGGVRQMRRISRGAPHLSRSCLMECRVGSA